MFSIVGIIVVMGVYYSDSEYQHHLAQALAGIAVFSTIATIVMFSTINFFLDDINPFKEEKQNYLKINKVEKDTFKEQKRKESAIKYLTGKIDTIKQENADWIVANKKEIESIIKKAKSLDRKIDYRENHIRTFVNKYYDIPKCKRCNTEDLYLVDFNKSGTGIEFMCSKCKKKD